MRQISVLITSAVFLAFLTPSVSADEIPTLNVTPLCHGIADHAADPLETGDPKVSFEHCMASEQSDRAALAKEWSMFAAEDKDNCTEEARTGGESSYTDLVTCLEMAREAEEFRLQSRSTQRDGAIQSNSKILPAYRTKESHHADSTRGARSVL